MGSSVKQKLVISAINLTEGGPLTVLNDCVAAAIELLEEHWEVIVLVNDRALIKMPGATIIEFPHSKHYWLLRLYYEWWHFRSLSKKLKPDLWLSLHDITPWVQARRQAVYCHNPAPFYQMTIREVWLEPKFLLFNLFYRYLYRVGIHRNRYVIVQQAWLRKEFMHLFDVRNVVVAYPVGSSNQALPQIPREPQNPFIFIYPALPRFFKNIESVCKAAQLLGGTDVPGFEMRLTIDGSENHYAADLVKQYANVPGICFIGKQPYDSMALQYAECDCLLFPSRLETWGLPISEAKALGKPMLVADLPYAHETVGNYDRICFFDPKDPIELSDKMGQLLRGKLQFDGSSSPDPSAPFARNWRELLLLLVKE
jgi:glycosyltransferase involved in cell wall biosynthesis